MWNSLLVHLRDSEIKLNEFRQLLEMLKAAAPSDWFLVFSALYKCTYLMLFRSTVSIMFTVTVSAQHVVWSLQHRNHCEHHLEHVDECWLHCIIVCKFDSTQWFFQRSKQMEITWFQIWAVQKMCQHLPTHVENFCVVWGPYEKCTLAW